MRYIFDGNCWLRVNKSHPNWIYGLTKKNYCKYYLLERD